MAMTHEKFVEMVGRLEEYAAREPGRYALRVGLLAGLGYAYLLLVLAVVLWLVYALVFWGRFNAAVVKIGWVLLTLAALVVRAMWVRVPPPDGIPLTREQAPRLFEMVGELTAKLDAPRIHRVLVDGDYNAGVAQVPRLGPLGWHRNYLVLGLPLLQALSPEQFRAVLAHELGHLSGNHGRFSSWIYRVRQTWFQLLARLEAEGRWGSAVFLKFFNWYAPYFNAYSFVLARHHEYDADRAAAEATSPQTAAEALLAVDLKGARLSESYWPEIYKQADAQAEPARGAYVRMSSFLREPVPEAEGANLLRRSLLQQTGYADTHPSLAARLAALGAAPADGARAAELAERFRLPPLEESAAAHLLGSHQGEFAERIDKGWHEQVAPQWRERHEYARQTREQLAALDERAAAGDLTEEEAWSRAYWTAEFKGDAEAEPLLRELLARRPDHPQANYALGQMLLERGDEVGVAHVERAMEAEPSVIAAGYEMLYDFMRERGRDEEARKYQKRLFEHYDALELAGKERDTFKDGDELLPHGLAPEQVERLRVQLVRCDIKAAYLARKRLEHFPEKPVYVLGVVPDAPWYKFRGSSEDAELARRIVEQTEFPAECFVVVLNRSFQRTRKALKGMEGALVYSEGA